MDMDTLESHVKHLEAQVMKRYNANHHKPKGSKSGSDSSSSQRS